MKVLWRRVVVASLAAALGALGPAGPAAGQPSVMLFAGYGGTNGIDNATTRQGADVDGAPVFGAVVAMPFDPGRTLELLVRQQSATLSPGGGDAAFDLTVRTLHVGGTLLLDGAGYAEVYAAGGVGATQFRPSTAGYGSEIKPSIHLGLGVRWPLGRHVALRADARGYLVLVNSGGGFLCSGGCVAVLQSDAVTQVEATIGLEARF